MFVRPNGSVTGSILVDQLPEPPKKKGPGRPRKAVTEEVAANPAAPEPEPEPEPASEVPVADHHQKSAHHPRRS